MRYELWIKRRKDCEPGVWVRYLTGTLDEVMEDFFYTKSQNNGDLEGLRIEWVATDA